MHICDLDKVTLIFVSHDLALGNYFDRQIELATLNATC
jgi:ABC-type lipoprotein export system ATPase subunit